jgi:dihydrofolate synthase/folylpolyglutamate synthase
LGRLESLSDWLKWQNSFHHQEIDLGLDRVQTVYQKLFSDNPPFKIITIAGTNGKGSTAAFIEGIYLQTPFKVGVFSSPHILEYNERYRIDGINVDDQIIVSAFEEIESKRGNVSLTYFEFSTLAALVIFRNLQIDLAILEVGLGGRLDSVNVTNPDLTIITSIDIDHSEYLGNTREKIATEKAGIMREGIVCICGDQNPPKSIHSESKRIGSKLEIINTPYPGRMQMMGDHQRINAQVAIRAAEIMSAEFPIEHLSLEKGISNVSLPGRQNIKKIGDKEFLFDVAHNPAAVKKLYETLNNSNKDYVAIFSALKDKDINQMIEIISPKISKWLIIPIDESRGLTTEELSKFFPENIQPVAFQSMSEAIQESFSLQDKKILIFGSFYTVASAMKELNNIRN